MVSSVESKEVLTDLLGKNLPCTHKPPPSLHTLCDPDFNPALFPSCVAMTTPPGHGCAVKLWEMLPNNTEVFSFVLSLWKGSCSFHLSFLSFFQKFCMCVQACMCVWKTVSVWGVCVRCLAESENLSEKSTVLLQCPVYNVGGSLYCLYCCR